MQPPPVREPRTPFHSLPCLSCILTVSQVTARLSELETTIEAGDRHRDNVLTSTAYQIETWTGLVRRKKAIFHTLNMLSIDVTRKCLVAEGWCPVFAKPKVRYRSRLWKETFLQARVALSVWDLKFALPRGDLLLPFMHIDTRLEAFGVQVSGRCSTSLTF